MSSFYVKRGGREFVQVYLDYGNRDYRDYWVDVGMNNPGDLFIGGDLVGLTEAEYSKRDRHKDELRNVEGHVRVYHRTEFGGFKFMGVWCPHSQSVEQSGPMLGETRMIHAARGGNVFCHASRSEEPCQ